MAAMRGRAAASGSESLAGKSITSQLGKTIRSMRLKASSVFTNFAPMEAGLSGWAGRFERMP
jgi:hypothetical protein